MTDQAEAVRERGPQRMQDFIFARELAEVYLLLDHLTLLGDRALKRLTITTLRPFTLAISTFAAVVLLLRTLW